MNSYLPTVTADPFTDAGGDNAGFDIDYRLFDKRQVRSGDETLDSLYVTEQRVYVKKVPIRRIDIDREFDVPLRTKETIFYKSEVPKKTVLFGATDTTVSESNNLTTAQTFAAGESAVVTNTVPNPDVPNVPFWGTGKFPVSTGSSNNFGILCSGRQLTDNFYAIKEEEVVKTSSTNLVKSYKDQNKLFDRLNKNYHLFDYFFYHLNLYPLLLPLLQLHKIHWYHPLYTNYHHIF